jgi:hypothetical protein
LKSLLRYSLLVCLLAAAPVLADESTVVVTPRVQRDEGLPTPVIWPSYSGSVGGNEVRNCLTWGNGWQAFVERSALRAMDRVGHVWIHNPGGMLLGKEMRYDQFSRCREAAKLTGNEVLQRVSRWDEFTREMSRVSERGELVIYVGGPHTLSLAKEENDEEWLQRALDEIRPVLDIRPPVIIGLDATYGRPANAKLEPYRQWNRRGGPNGLTAQLIKRFLAAGHEVILEPGLLASADWARDRVSLLANHGFWNGKLKGRDIRVRHYLPDFGSYLKPSEVTTRQFRYLQLLKDRTSEEQQALVNAVITAGYDVVLPSNQHPDWPYRADKSSSDSSSN